MNYHRANDWFAWLNSGHSTFTCVAMIVYCGEVVNVLAFPLEEGLSRGFHVEQW